MERDEEFRAKMREFLHSNDLSLEQAIFGNYSMVLKVYDKRHDKNLAVKLGRRISGKSLAKKEFEICKKLQKFVGFVKVFDFKELDFIDAIVMEQLNNNVMRIRSQMKLSKKTIYMIGLQMLYRLENLHNEGIVHCDVSPNNFMIGRCDEGTCHVIHLIDFGLSRRFLTQDTKLDSLDTSTWLPVSNDLFSSIGSQCGWIPSRQDDLESLGYVIMFLLLNHLPWHKLAYTMPNDYKRGILKMKMEMKMETDCSGLQPEVAVFVRRTREFDRIEKPDYAMLRSLLLEALEADGATCDWQFDWMLRKTHEKHEMKSVLPRISKKSIQLKTIEKT